MKLSESLIPDLEFLRGALQYIEIWEYKAKLTDAEGQNFEVQGVAPVLTTFYLMAENQIDCHIIGLYKPTKINHVVCRRLPTPHSGGNNVPLSGARGNPKKPNKKSAKDR